MSTTNHVFSPTTPIEYTYQWHMLFPLRILNLKIGKGDQVIKSISNLGTTMHCSLPRAQG